MILKGSHCHRAAEGQLVNTAEVKQPGLVSPKTHNFVFQIQLLSHLITPWFMGELQLSKLTVSILCSDAYATGRVEVLQADRQFTKNVSFSNA